MSTLSVRARMQLPSSHPLRRAFDLLLLGVTFGCFDDAKVRKNRVLLVEPAPVVVESDPGAFDRRFGHCILASTVGEISGKWRPTVPPPPPGARGDCVMVETAVGRLHQRRGTVVFIATSKALLVTVWVVGFALVFLWRSASMSLGSAGGGACTLCLSLPLCLDFSLLPGRPHACLVK